MYLIFFGTWPYLAMCPQIVKSIPNPIHWATDFEKPSLFLGGLISSKTKKQKEKNKQIGTAPDLLVLHWSSSIPNPIHWLLIWDLWALGLLACPLSAK